MSERDFFWVFVGAAAVVGVGLILFAAPVTRHYTVRAGRAREKYAHRPRILRPQIANARPSILKTRLTGVGFLVIGGIAAWQRLR